ncbi:MAG: DUF58 domain-containing protein [Planctomycetaceae bacterium]|nr:DUF58 domain-containing protein [Planctomycetaceae bacterium]
MAERAMRAEQYLAPETLGQLAPFELRSRMIVEGVMSGMHRSPYQGLAVEFAEHRQYSPGDSIRQMDWKVFARTDKMYVKRYVQETNLDVMVLVDRSRSMRYGTLAVKRGWGGTDASRGSSNWTKFDHATATAAALAYVCLHQGDRVGLALFDEELRTQVKRSSQRDQWRAIVGALSGEPVDGRARIGRAVDQMLARVTNRALFVVVSDFLMPVEEIRSAVARLAHRGHDVAIVQTLDRQELRFELDAPALFEGLEGEESIETDPRAVRAAYLDLLREHVDAVGRVARGFGADAIVCDTHESVGPALAALLDRRMAFAGRRGG